MRYITLSLLVWLICLTVAAGSLGDHQKACLELDELSLTRPDPVGEPTDVNVSLYLIDIDSVDDINQSFAVDMIISYWWQDKRLIEKIKNTRESCRYPLSSLWHPHIYILNIHGLQKMLPDTVLVKAGGHVKYRQRYYGRLTAPMDLRNFPLDVQTLPVRLVSFEYGPDKVRLNFKPERSGQVKKFSATSWRIGEGQERVGVYRAKAKDKSTPIIKLVEFEYKFTAKRWVNYYLWKVFTPLVLIVFMSWAVFWVSPLKMEVQVGLSATTILTMIAFLFSISNLLPKISYLTIMDQFVFICLVFVFSAFIESIITCSLALDKKVERALKIDRYAKRLFPLAFFIVLMLFFIKVFYI